MRNANTEDQLKSKNENLFAVAANQITAFSFTTPKTFSSKRQTLTHSVRAAYYTVYCLQQNGKSISFNRERPFKWNFPYGRDKHYQPNALILAHIYMMRRRIWMTCAWRRVHGALCECTFVGKFLFACLPRVIDCPCIKSECILCPLQKRRKRK